MKIKVPGWLKAMKPTAKDEKIRAALGLYPKADGWYKSIGGKTRYICKPSRVTFARDAMEAKAAALAGRTPVVAGHTLTVEQLVETFLARMLDRVRAGDMARQTYDDYVRTLARFADTIGGERLAASIGPDDFSMYMKDLAKRPPSTVRREVQYIDRLFNWAGPGKRYMNWLPFVMRGPDWNKPSDEEIAVHAADSDKAYSPAQVAAAFKVVKDNPLLNAAAHLGLMCAFTPKDVGTLPEASVDLDAAEIRFARGKTGVARLCPLLPPAVDALRAYLEYRRRFKSVKPAAAGLFFRTREGMPYDRWFGSGDGDESNAGHRDNLLSRRWTTAVGLPFSGLRSTFATHADDWSDQRAIDVVMGHKVGKVGRHIRKHYAKQFSPERARELVEVVWLRAFGKAVPSSPRSL